MPQTQQEYFKIVMTSLEAKERVSLDHGRQGLTGSLIM
jgi:hypothetical protein